MLKIGKGMQTTYDSLMANQVASGLQSSRNLVRDAVAVGRHVRLSGPLPTHDALLVDGKPRQGRHVRNRGAVVFGAGGHVDGQRTAVVRPGGVVAGADGAPGGDAGVVGGRRAGAVADALLGSGDTLGLPRVPLALDAARSLDDRNALDAGATAKNRMG